MNNINLLVITNSFPNQSGSYIGGIFVKEQVKILKKYFDNVYVISPVAYGIERLRKTKHADYHFDNVQVFFIKYINNPFFWYYGRSIWAKLEARAIKSLIEKNNLHFNLIHSHFTWPSGAVAVELKKIMGIPVVITEHTHTTLYKALNGGDSYYTNIWKQSDAIIRVNKKDVPSICRSGVEPTKVFSIANGYDPNKFHPIDKQKARQSLGLPSDKKLILNISRLYKEKGQKYLISAISEIIKNQNDVCCYIGGTGPLKDDLEQQISTLNAQEYVKLVGFIPDERMVLWMNAADIFILPSLGEGNPTIMFECLGCGKPLIGTKVGGVPEIINSEDYGLLVEPADPIDLAEKIIVALDREWDSDKILAYSEQYSWENIVKEIMRVYDQVLG
jgi:teichuronic acid biosynthesis glycosyltransferase TuaC